MHKPVSPNICGTTPCLLIFPCHLRVSFFFFGLDAFDPRLCLCLRNSCSRVHTSDEGSSRAKYIPTSIRDRCSGLVAFRGGYADRYGCGHALVALHLCKIRENRDSDGEQKPVSHAWIEYRIYTRQNVIEDFVSPHTFACFRDQGSVLVLFLCSASLVGYSST